MGLVVEVDISAGSGPGTFGQEPQGEGGDILLFFARGFDPIRDVEAERFVARGEVGRFTFPSMTVAQVEVRGGIDLELRALQWLFGSWLPRSGYVPDDHPCFEAWIGLPFSHGTEYFELHAQLPVRRC